jgi:hypothetical protein
MFRVVTPDTHKLREEKTVPPVPEPHAVYLRAGSLLILYMKMRSSVHETEKGLALSELLCYNLN